RGRRDPAPAPAADRHPSPQRPDHPEIAGFPLTGSGRATGGAAAMAACFRVGFIRKGPTHAGTAAYARAEPIHGYPYSRIPMATDIHTLARRIAEEIGARQQQAEAAIDL